MPAADRRQAEALMDLHRERELLDHMKDREAVHGGPSRKIYWAGGEPLLDPVHTKVMQSLAISPTASAISLTYNTNLSRLHVGEWNWLESLKAFRRVHIFVSVDALGEVGEYLRTGFLHSVFMTNFRELQAWRLGETRQVTLDLTLNLLNLFHLEPLMDFAIQEKVELDAKLMIESIANSYLMIDLLPRSLKDQAVRAALDAIRRRGQPRELERLRQTLELALQRSSWEECTSAQEFRSNCARAVRQWQVFERLRPSSITLKASLPPGIWQALPFANLASQVSVSQIGARNI